MTDQTRIFSETEGLRYVKARQDQVGPTVSLEDFEGVPVSDVNSILDVGCGIGINLEFAAEHFGASQSVGVEPAGGAIEILRSRYPAASGLAFEASAMHALPFDTNTFDLVMCWSVLHWVGRDEYLQSVGELIRVSRRYILVMDFYGSQDYRVPYGHHDGLYTFKQDFQPLFESSGATRTMWTRIWDDQGHGLARIPVKDRDFTPFLANPMNYRGRKACLFRKSSDVLPVHESTDFISD